MKRIKVVFECVVFAAGVMMIPEKTEAKDQGIVEGNCCAWPTQTCSYGGINVADHLYSTGTGLCP